MFRINREGEKKMIIAPSVLSMDYSQMEKQMKFLNQSKAEWLHFDVMDGHFVPNLTFGPNILNGFRKMTDLFLDVHLMVEDPTFFSTPFIEAGADAITFHYESMKGEDEIFALIQKIKNHHCQVGMSIKPNTPLDVLSPFLSQLDLVLIMSVEPGFGGQAFISSALTKISQLKSKIDHEKLTLKIEVDGGINAETAKLCKEAGADVLVAGSYIFKQDIQKAVDSLC